MRGGMSAWLSHHFLWNWNLEMSVYEEGENQWTWIKTSQTHKWHWHYLIWTWATLLGGNNCLPTLLFSPLHHPLLSSVPHQILACLCSPEILMQAISEKNQVPPTNTPPVTDYDLFFIWQCAECCRFKN